MVLGVVGSVELASDLEDSDCRATAGVASTVPWEAVLVCVEGLGECNSLRVAKDGLPASSFIDLRSDLFPRLRAEPEVGMGPSRGTSAERRNLVARLMREGLFFGPTMSFVGAVVIISGAVQLRG